MLSAGSPTSMGSDPGASYELKILHSRTAHDALFGVHAGSDRILAIGDHGLLLISHDRGSSWEEVAVPTSAALLDIDVLTDGHGVIVGQFGTILHTEDGGKHWAVVNSNTNARLFAVSIEAGGGGIAVGEFGTVMYTTDHGKRWQQAGIEWEDLTGLLDAPHLYDVYVSAENILIVGEFGLVLSARAPAMPFTVMHQGDLSLFALDVTADGAFWCVGQGGLIIHSPDKGESWQTRYLDAPVELLDIQIDIDGQGILATRGPVFHSLDAGLNWQEISTPPSLWHQAVAKMDVGEFLLVGAYGLITRLAQAKGISPVK